VTRLRLSNDLMQQYGPSYQQLDVEVTPETSSRLHVKIRPSGRPRWEVPDSIVPR